MSSPGASVQIIPAPWLGWAAMSLSAETEPILAVVLLAEEPEQACAWQSVDQHGGLFLRARLPQAVQRLGHTGAEVVDRGVGGGVDSQGGDLFLTAPRSRPARRVRLWIRRCNPTTRAHAPAAAQPTGHCGTSADGPVRPRRDMRTQRQRRMSRCQRKIVAAVTNSRIAARRSMGRASPRAGPARPGRAMSAWHAREAGGGRRAGRCVRCHGSSSQMSAPRRRRTRRTLRSRRSSRTGPRAPSPRTHGSSHRAGVSAGAARLLFGDSSMLVESPPSPSTRAAMRSV